MRKAPGSTGIRGASDALSTGNNLALSKARARVVEVTHGMRIMKSTSAIKPHALRPQLVHVALVGIALLIGSFATAARADAQESLCDNSYQDCRAPIVQLIRNETQGIDVSFWFMTDPTYSSEIIKRWKAGVPVRVILDTRADASYGSPNVSVRQSFINAGIPVRNRKTTTGINHWKMILYYGQQKLHFSAANFAYGSYQPTTPYTGYVDEAIYFTDDPAIIQSFETKFEDCWTDTVNYANLANITTPLARKYPIYPISPDLNFLLTATTRTGSSLV